MAYLGLRANSLYLPAAPYFFAALPTAGTYLRGIATRSIAVSAWAAPSKANLSVAQVVSEAKDEQMKVLDDILSTSHFLRSIPLASTLLVARFDNKTHGDILTSVLRTPQDHQCAILRAVSSEVQLALGQEGRPAPALLQPSVGQTSCHNKLGLFLDDFPAGFVSEKDYSMLAAKILEDPDFPVVPPWHEEFSTLRPWFDVTISLPEDRKSDIFVHESLLKKVFLYFNKHMGAPPAPKLGALRFSASREVEKMMQAEVNVAALLEPSRLLQVKIEDLIPDVAKTDEEHKALRKVSLSGMNIPRVLKYCERSVIILLNAKMRAIMRNSKHIADIDDTCICDIISQYSDDEGEDHFNGASAMKNIFPQRKRNTVLGWAASIEAPAFHHGKLSNVDGKDCEPWEPIGEADGMSEVDGELQKTSEITWELQGCSLEFPRGHDGEVLLGYGYQAGQEISEGHFTNMISAASASDTGSDSSANKDGGGEAANRRNSDTSLESSADDTKEPYDYLGKHLAMAST